MGRWCPRTVVAVGEGHHFAVRVFCVERVDAYRGGVGFDDLRAGKRIGVLL
jgi:hypothetical protein